ncbi:ABC-2 type transporter-domain-containing protein [Aspergillus ambiguus]|uniref:ABC-2 type transporter-domain-containing protein n=1 Tax=Aspergillus ambiguus TaxID=176160 RepID=UPI003CCE0AA2
MTLPLPPKENSWRSRLSDMHASSETIDSQTQLFDTTGSSTKRGAIRGAKRELPWDEAGVHNLAQVLTAQSISADCDSPFDPNNQTYLNPNSPEFKARDWAKAFYNIRYTAEGLSPRMTGFAFRNMNVCGYGNATDYQMSVGNAPLKIASSLAGVLGMRKKQRVDILRGLDGLVLPGEQLCVLGPPGSGCSTFLKTISGDTLGLDVDPGTFLNYNGITAKQMTTRFRGEAIYTAEVDEHFPMLTVGDTLYFAALARAPRTIPGGLSREEYATHLRDVIMSMFGISHTKNTRVGNDFVRGVSGGERKRVTIAEAALSYAPLQCWDNSTRGLDSANAIEFCKTLRLQSDIFGMTSCVAIYQAPQAAYELFDKVIVFYEGRQIYFGRAYEAKAYFEALGFECPEAQTTPDFLTSMTSASERVVKPGFENLVPRTPDEFAQRWRDSPERKDLLKQIQQYTIEHPFDNADMRRFAEARKSEKSTKQREKSPYTLSYWRQIKLCMWREFRRLRSDIGVPLFTIVLNLVEMTIIASLFFDMEPTTSSFFQRGALMFMMILLAALSSMLEIMALYEKRNIVEKHDRYALYHPSAEAIASAITDIPSKLITICGSSLIVYFMTNLRRTPEAFFFYLLMAFTALMCMSMFFRLFGSVTKTLAQAMAPVSVITLAISLYTGFAIPVPYMRGWARWIQYINPISYAFEAIMVNELHGREFPCTSFVPSGPGYENASGLERVCSTVGSVPGKANVNGDAFLEGSYGYFWVNRWRDFGIVVAFTIFFTLAYLVGTELISGERSKGEVLVFRRSKMHRTQVKRQQNDEEQTEPGSPISEKVEKCSEAVTQVEKQSAVFHWQNVCYDITANGEQRRLLDNVDGWIKPGSLTALMGVSGAGKTTLLDVLASRKTTGVITGDMLVDGRQRDSSFQRKTGYVQQQDLHLATSTVREALEFSALLRQPSNYTRQEKLEYVDTVIGLLNMEEYADAVVGVPGSGLNVEQRKRLTIGVELAARPKLLLFLDEPTSGLDSQTSWSICNLMEKLTNSGQAILCTIHQPSAMLFQRFDRLLLLARGGKTVYFGEIGRNAKVLMDYFVRNGADPCPPGVNPAEHMLEVIGAAPGASTSIDWPAVWRDSPEYHEVHEELGRLRELANHPSAVVDSNDQSAYGEFAAPFTMQTYLVTLRIFQQMWRTPSYIFSKSLLCVACAMFIGFSFFDSDNTAQGMQNQMFGVFLFLMIYVQIVQQVMPNFVLQRTLYEARERQSKTYNWQSFILSNLFVELAWNTLMSVLSFVVWYYPMGVWRNSLYTNALNSRSGLAFLIVWEGFLYATTLAFMCIAGFESDQAAGGICMLLSIMGFLFCGVLAGPNTLPRFWIFMYHVSPFTYIVNCFLTTALANAPMTCSANEVLSFFAPQNMTCSQYMASYMERAGGFLYNPDTLGGGDDQCRYCAMDSTDQFLKNVSLSFENRWRDVGILWAYIVFNIAASIFLYWLARVPKGKKS